MPYEPTIGLEIHSELKTKSKMFCSCANDPDETHANVNICPICVGHPGTLPTINEEAIKKLLMVGVALNCKIAEFSKFDRKNYFYPDLPKGYQISQYDEPLITGGELQGVRLRRIHLEEDAGRLVHDVHRSNIDRVESNGKQIVLKEESYRLMGFLFEIQNKLGSVHKEKNYQDAVEAILGREKIPYEREKRFKLKLDNLEISDFVADFIVEGKILLETKASKFITQEDIRQTLRYIKSLNLPLGIIVNFRGEKLDYKRIINPKFAENSISLGQNLGEGYSLVDFNRAGVPLMELVTEPDIRSAAQALAFAKELQLILRYLGVSDADMEKGQMRVEANVSVAPSANGQSPLGVKVEVKNINSFKAVSAAIAYEIGRQKGLLARGEKITQETRGWNEDTQATFPQRSKEEAHDYRYFPEPDLPPFETSVFDPEHLRLHLPELPAPRRERLAREYALTQKQAELLTDDPALARFFEEAVSELATRDEARAANVGKEPRNLLFNYLTSDLLGLLAARNETLNESEVNPEELAHLADLLADEKIGSRQAKDILKKMVETGEDPEAIMRNEGLETVSDHGAVEAAVKEIIAEHPQAAADYKKGKQASLQFLLGQAMGKLKGRGNPAKLKEVLEKFLREE